MLATYPTAYSPGERAWGLSMTDVVASSLPPFWHAALGLHETGFKLRPPGLRCAAVVGRTAEVPGGGQ